MGGYLTPVVELKASRQWPTSDINLKQKTASDAKHKKVYQLMKKIVSITENKAIEDNKEKQLSN